MINEVNIIVIQSKIVKYNADKMAKCELGHFSD
jgi:hypothetical protein